MPAIFLAVWIVISGLIFVKTSKYELQVLGLLVFIHFVSYIYASLKKLRKIRELNLQINSNKFIENRIKMVKNILILISILYLIGLMEVFIPFLLNKTFLNYITLIALVAILVGLLNNIANGLQYYSIIHEGLKIESINSKFNNQKYQSSKLSKNDAIKYLNTLQEHMKSEKSYIRFDLSLSQLSRELEISERHLSQVINEYLNQNFYDFVNQKRIELAQRELLNTEKRISEIMYDVGFTSRSSFNTAFKKFVGKTPSEFRKNMTI